MGFAHKVADKDAEFAERLLAATIEITGEIIGAQPGIVPGAMLLYAMNLVDHVLNTMSRVFEVPIERYRSMFLATMVARWGLDIRDWAEIWRPHIIAAMEENRKSKLN